LAGAIEELVRHFDEINPQCQFVFRVESSLPALPDQLAIVAYRIVQEALTNVIKHAQASRCEVRIAVPPDHPCVQLVIEDNGKGFAPTAGGAGIGIVGMRERAHAIGGPMNIDSAPGRGTTVTVVMPGCPCQGDAASGPVRPRRQS
jgi:two-component system sensor histidine kinase UhpB